MAVVTSQQLSQYYDLYRSIEVTFTKDVIQLLGFLQEQVALKIMGTQWHCLIYSSSLEGAKLIVSLKPDQIERLRTGGNLVAVRYGFQLPDSVDPLTFFTNGKIRGYSRYNSPKSQDLYFITVEYTQRPSDHFIEILGRFLEANVNSQKRRDVRVPVSEGTIRKMGFASCSTTVAVDGVDRKCLIRDLSFGGAMMLIPGVPKFLMGRSVLLRLTLDESGQHLLLPGQIIRADAVEGRRDIAMAAIRYDEAQVPHAYKLKLNDAIRTIKIPNAP